MKRAVIRLVGLVIPSLLAGPAGAWTHADAYGGTASHTAGSQSLTRTNAAGGSVTQTYGQGATATSRYGGSATHTYGQGTTATSANGATASHTAGSGYSTYTSASGSTAYHSAYYGAHYPAYHPPVAVNSYGSSCYNCGGWSAAGAAATGAAVGIVAGAAIASANTAAVASNAYNAGYVAGTTTAPPAPAPVSTAFAMGAIYAVLPAGCVSTQVRGSTYYLYGNTWFQPAYGANGVYYRVVPTP